MAHNSRLRSDYQWSYGPVVSGNDLKTLDTTLTKAVNGDEGGTWNPSSSVIVGGAGFIFVCPVTLSGGGGVVTTTNFRIVFESGYFALAGGHTSASRTIVTPLQSFATSATVGNDPTYAAPITRQHPSMFSTLLSLPYTTILSPLRVHDQATLQQVTFTFRIGESHLPDIMPAFRVIRVDKSGNVQPLKSTAGSVADPNGWQYFPKPASAALYFAAGAAQTLLYTCDQFQVVDLANYTYFVEIADESGGNGFGTTGNTFHSAATLFGGIFDMRPQ
jgi:hypothetical protein